MKIAIITGIALIISIVYLTVVLKKNKALEASLRELNSSLKSAFVKFGKSFEHFVPFSKDFPGDKQKTVFLGMPVDFICFDENAVKFIEVKTGSSNLNPNQKRVKKLIEAKAVEWHELRY